ncbi:MAG: Cof-type HAD-IIB family hydrolase [Oscillospiraceae bacterium]|nr:Cof-type HAD-IIB family hydrolase [Oscillospiraceae bacterium]MBR6678215.1 Cof-type HAD-IIB family hydrolase [Oscillospiraceae bacterium]
MIKAIFFDADGTLISHRQNAVPPSARAALGELQRRGIRCILATGRHITEVECLPVGDIPFDGYVTVNGQLCLDENKHPLSDSPIAAEAMPAIIRHFREKKVPLVLKEQDRIYVNCVTDRLRATQADISTAVPDLGEYSGKPIYQAVYYIPQEEDGMLAELAPYCYMTRWHKNGIDLLDRQGGKVRGIREYLERRGILPEETMAFGDGDNDIEMLRFAGIGVAMGNASDAVKAQADYVTASVDKDGIALALQHFGLI